MTAVAAEFRPSTVLTRIRGWTTRGTSAVIDQAAVSGGNFALTILLARWLAPIEYGNFAAVFSIVLLVGTFHNSLVLEPIAVLGWERSRINLRAYLAAQLRLHGWLVILPSVLLVAIAGALSFDPRAHEIALAATGAAVALPAMLFLGVTRRFCYLLDSPRSVLAGSLSYLLIALLGLATLRGFGALSPFSGFALVGAASLAGAVLQLLLISRSDAGQPPPATVTLHWRQLLAEHWHFGRWLVASALIGWLSRDAYYTFTFAFLGAETTAALRALSNLTSPMDQVLTALGVMLMPLLARHFQRHPGSALRRETMIVTASLCALTVSYLVVLTFCGHGIVQLLYRGRYAASLWILPYLALLPVLRSLTIGGLLALMVFRESKTIFRVNLISSLSTLAINIYLTRRFGIQGVIFGWLLLGVVQVALFAVALRRHRRRTWAPA